MNTTRRAISVRWADDEINAVVLRAATLLLEGEKFRGVGALVLEAQRVLPIGRRKAESSILNFAKAQYGDAIDAKVSELAIAKYQAKAKTEEKVEAKEEVKPEPEVLEKKAKVEEPVPPLIQMAMGFMIESITDEFKKQLRHALNAAAADVIEEVSKATTSREFFQPATVQPAKQEVSAINPVKGEEVKATKIKVAILGGNGKGKDQEFITKGLEDVYDFRFIDSEKSVTERVQACDLVVVRTAYCSHGMQHSAERAVPKERVIKISKGSPSAINEMLLDRYVNSSKFHSQAAH